MSPSSSARPSQHDGADLIEVLTGLNAGDTVLVP